MPNHTVIWGCQKPQLHVGYTEAWPKDDDIPSSWPKTEKVSVFVPQQKIHETFLFSVFFFLSCPVFSWIVFFFQTHPQLFLFSFVLFRGLPKFSRLQEEKTDRLLSFHCQPKIERERKWWTEMILAIRTRQFQSAASSSRNQFPFSRLMSGDAVGKQLGCFTFSSVTCGHGENFWGTAQTNQ